MQINRRETQSPAAGPAAYFAGTVQLAPLTAAFEGVPLSGASVTFQPGARTAWHTHPLGQLLIVTAGNGWAQSDGGPVEQFAAGDVLWFSPGEKHWHGATATSSMTHIAIAPTLDGVAVTWLEQVSDDQFLAGDQGR